MDCSPRLVIGFLENRLYEEDRELPAAIRSGLVGCMQVLQKRRCVHSSVEHKLRTLLYVASMDAKCADTRPTDPNEASGSQQRTDALYRAFIQSLCGKSITAATDSTDIFNILGSFPLVLPIITQQLWHQSFGPRTEFVGVLHQWWLALSSKGVEKAMDMMDMKSIVLATLNLVATGSDEEVAASIRLCISLVQVGKEAMQKQFCELLADRRGKWFLVRLRQILRRSQDDLRELHIIGQQLIRDYSPDPGQKPKTLEALVQESGLFDVRLKQQLPLDLLMLLRSFVSASGHFLPLQDLLGGAVHEVNLAADIVDALLELCYGVGPLNLEFGISCIKTLTKMAEGPCRKVQTVLISQSSLLQAVNLLIPAQLQSGQKVTSTPHSAVLLQTLKSELSHLLFALLEGIPPVCPMPFLAQRILDGLNLKSIAELVIDMHSKLLRDRDPAKESAGIRFHAFLQTLEFFARSDPSRQGEASRSVLATIKDESIPAYQYFASNITMVELVHAGCLVPHFFQIPKRALGEIAEIQRRRIDEQILPSLIMKPEYEALMAFCRHAEGIGAELRYANAQKTNRASRMLTQLAAICSRWYLTNVVIINILVLVSFEYQIQPISSPPQPFWSSGEDEQPSVPLFDIRVVAQVNMRFLSIFDSELL